ncbi:MAG: Rrf2 family transcriptional regulator [Oscillospiraceae bacterium]|nr:Rrf2 family transcriptional regulator [Oscillospiraceae bacterium]
MKISTRGRYALRMMLDIALHSDEGSISLKSIAQRQEISVKYLEQIVTPLSRGGLLQATRGAQGGYWLNRLPEDYTVGEILRTIEGSLAPVACLDSGEAYCQRIGQCVTVEVYRRIDEAIDNVVDNITLQDLVDIQREKRESAELPADSLPLSD